MPTYKNCLDYLIQLNAVCCFQSVEKSGKATNSELRRWFERGSVWINGDPAAAIDPFPAECRSVVLHPNSPKRRSTIW